MSTWPDPNNPGVPLNPDVTGEHHIGDSVALWYSTVKKWGIIGSAKLQSPKWMADQSWAKYIGPILTSAERNALPLAIAGIVDCMRVDFYDGYILASKVALAALEPSDGAVYSNNFVSHEYVIRRHCSRIIKQRLEETAEAWNIDMDAKP
jgi:hypothetical protein